MTWETPIYVKPSTIRHLEDEIEDLESRISCLEDELKFERSQAEAADKALVETWSFVPKDKRHELMDRNEYIEEMFWDDRKM